MLRVLLYGQALANNLKAENATYDPSTKELSFELSWDNAWRVTPSEMGNSPLPI